MSIVSDVINFHEKFGINPVKSGTVLKMLPPDVVEYRMKFLDEELTETSRAFLDQSADDAIDGLLDLIYVAIGTLHLMGMREEQIQDHWNEIQRANMSKVRSNPDGDPRSKRGHSLDIVKPEGWVGPNHEKILEMWANKLGDEHE